MIIKKLFLTLCYIYAVSKPIPVFCMMEGILETGISKEPAQSNQPELIDEWSKYFEKDENIEKSFIFDTKDLKTKIIAIQTNQKTYFFHFVDSKLLPLSTLSGKFFDKVEHYIPAVSEEGERFIFYVTKKEPAFFFKEKYVVHKMSFRQGSDYIKSDPLFEHNTPIMRLDMIQEKKKNYLVVGSFYPSIKLYDLNTNTEFGQLHNRFLLGTTDQKLIYAEKIGPRPYFGLTRMLDYGLNKQYNCTLFSLSPSFTKKNVLDKTNAKKYSENFVIDFKHYPFVIGKSSLIFDPNDNTIIDFKNMFNLSLLSAQIMKGEKIEFADGATVNDKLNKIVELFTDKKFLTVFKKSITYESFMNFAHQSKAKKTLKKYGLLYYLSSIVEPLVQKIIEPKSHLCNDIATNIAYHVLGQINKFGGNSAAITFTKEGFNGLKQVILDNRFNLEQSWWVKIKTDLINDTPMYQPQYIPQEDVKSVYIHDEHIIIQTKKKILHGILTDISTVFEECYTIKDTIYNSYIIDNTLFIIQKDGLYQLKLSDQALTLQQGPLKELYPAEKVQAIQNIITKLQKENALNDLKSLFKKTATFQINSLNDIPNFKGVRGETGITPCLKEGYLRPILRKWMSHIATNYKSSFDNENEFMSVIYALENKVNDGNIWITDLQVKDVYTKFDQYSILSSQSIDVKYLKEQEDIYTKTVLNRFKTVDLESVQKSDLDEYMRALKLCYGMETVTFEIGGKNQTYLAYARNHFIQKADLIKNLKIDPTGVLHKATRTNNE